MVLDWNQYLEKSIQAVSEGIVLLENKNNILPIKREETIAVYGRIQLHYYKSGTGSGGMVNVSEVVGITEGLKRRGAKIHEGVLKTYEAWDEQHPFEQGAGWGEEPWAQLEMELEDGQVEQWSKESDVAVVILGRTAGEEMDYANVPGAFLLAPEEEAMLATVRKHYKKMVVLLNVAAVIDMSFLDRYKPDAAAYVWQGGMIGGLGTADVLLGDATPSGKLSDTIAYKIEDHPAASNFGNIHRAIYQEDIYLGYRYFETFAKEKVRFPFGFGLSYTSFSIQPQDFTHENGQTRICFQVTNTGKVYAGKEVVQVYASQPQGVLGKPDRILCGFGKTALLQPGETQHMAIVIKDEDLSSYDDGGATGHRYCYLLEAGEYQFHIGSSVRDTVPAGSFLLENIKVIQQCESAMAPVLPFTRMRNENGTLVYEDAPTSTIDEAARREKHMPQELPQAEGTAEYTLADVKRGLCTLDQFVAQLSDFDLACMVRGEGMGSPRVTPGTASAFGGVSTRLTELGVPAGCCSDGPSGMRLDCGTKAFSLPNGTLLACTFNEELLTELFGFVGKEMSANKVDCLLGPGMNIHRHPLNGRNFEYFSEDPFLTGHIAKAQLLGLQESGVTGTIKHFCGNNQETGRHTIDSVISERALREIYLKGFEIAVKEGHATSVMTTYGSVNGLWTANQFDLNTMILRQEWGFEGFTMTDWWANINRRGQEPDKSDLAAMVMAQNDVYMVCANSEENQDNIMKSLESGELKRAELQRNAKNILGFLLNTHALQRLMGEEETVEIINQPADAQDQDGEVEFIELKEYVHVDLKGISTTKGQSHSFVLEVRDKGTYEFTISASSTQSELAQIPVTMFSMGTASGTFTWNGTGGEVVTFTSTVPIFSRFNTIRLYFAQSGLDLDSMTFRYIGQ